jgi:hypothetical protein
MQPALRQFEFSEYSTHPTGSRIINDELEEYAKNQSSISGQILID